MQQLDSDNQERKPLRTVLVYPSAQQSVKTLYTFNKNQSIGYKPPQSILILATYLRQKGFEDTHCLDAQVEEFTAEQTAKEVAAMQPDVVGITAWTDFWYPTWKTLVEIRKKLPNAVLIVGGPHASVYPEETLEVSSADYVVAGDGEDVLLEIMEALRDRRAIPSLAGLWRQEDGKAVSPPSPIAQVDDITAIPVPDRTLLPYKRYSSILTPSDYETTMVTSRGCPYKCVFCKMAVQKVYARSAEQVVEEFRQIEQLGIKDVQVYDDTFTWGQARAMDICQGIIDSGIKVNWAIRDRTNRVTPELYKQLKKAGCYRVHFGVETGSAKILKNSGKFLTLEQIREGVRIAKDIDMMIMTYFMFGFIDEEMSDAKMTIELAKELDADYASFGVLIPYPGTEIYKEGLTRGIIPRDYWRDFARSPSPDYEIPHLIEDHLSRQDLIELKNSAARSFYFRPKMIFRELRKLNSMSEFTKKAKMGFQILVDGVGDNKSSMYRH